MPLKTYHCSKRELWGEANLNISFSEISLLVPDVEEIFFKKMDLTAEINRIYRQK